MKIQFNTDKTIDGSERHQDYFSDQISKKLDRFHPHISRIEAHISDENGQKEGINDIRCLIEARIKGKNPIAVSEQAKNIELAVSGAIQKLKTALESIIDRMKEH